MKAGDQVIILDNRTSAIHPSGYRDLKPGDIVTLIEPFNLVDIHHRNVVLYECRGHSTTTGSDLKTYTRHDDAQYVFLADVAPVKPRHYFNLETVKALSKVKNCSSFVRSSDWRNYANQ